MKKQSKKKVTAILLLIAILIGMVPAVQSDTVEGIKPSPDYGIYDKIEEIQDEKNDRINSPEILNETEGRFDDITMTSGEEKFDFTAGRETVSPNIMVPKVLGIYDAMLEWDSINNKQITDWIFPPPLGKGLPLHYYIYSKYITNTTIIEQWTNASLREEVITPDILHLSRWWEVNVDDDAGNIPDIEVFFDPVWEWTIGEIFDRIVNQDPIEIPVSVHFDIRRLNNAPFNIPEFRNLEVYVAKSLSYSGKNFVLFIGLNFSHVATRFNASVSVSKVGVGGLSINWNTFPPSIDWDLADVINLVGPYYLNWDYPLNEAISTFSLEIASARIEFTDDPDEPYHFLNRSWVDLDFKNRTTKTKVPNYAEVMVDADDDLSSFDKITWDAQHECDAFAKFFDSQQNVTYAEIEIGNLVDEIKLTMDVVEKNNQNVTIINYTSPGGIVDYFNVQHYEFFDISYENLTQEKIDNGEVEYIHLFFNVSRLPKRLYLEGVFYLEEVEDTPSMGLGGGIVPQVIEMLAHRVISRFTRISKTLSSIPYRLLAITEQGSFATIDTFGLDDIDRIEFVFTSGDYVTTHGNFFAFYNNTRPSNYPIAQISLSGRISKVSYFNASFQEDAEAEIGMMSNERFRSLYVDDINLLYAEVNISNVPGSIRIEKAAEKMSYDGAGTTIDELRFVSDYQGSYMDLRIFDLNAYIEVDYSQYRTYIATKALEDVIGEIEFLVTTGPIYRLSGNHLLVRQETDFSLISGRIKDISMLEYIPGFGGKITVNFVQENTMNISLLDNRSEKIAADLIIDPMPNFISVNLSALFMWNIAGFDLPQLDTGGVLGFVNIIFGIAAMGNEILAIIDKATHSALANIGNLVTDLSFSYSTNSHTTLIGKIIRGEHFTLDDVDWMHGISAIQQVEGSDISMAAKLYLSGLPTNAGISTRIFGSIILLDLHITNYAPKHNWLCIDIKGLQNRDVLLYINDIQEGMDLNLKIELVSLLNIIPQYAEGNITMDSNVGVGSLYGRMRQIVPEITITEVFLSELPKDLDTSFLLAGNITIDYKANRGIEYMFAKNTRTRNGEFYDIYALLHEVPKELELWVTPVYDYDMDGSLLQTLPTMNITSSDKTLDAYIFADGKGIGQMGVFEVQLVNVGISVRGKYEDDKYKVTSTGIDYLWVHVMELPIMDGHNTRSIELVGKDIYSFDITVDNLFGNYPIIGIENTNGGELQMVIDHEMDDSKVGLALIDFKTTGGLPSSPSILINGGSVNLEKGSSHVIVPAPILTLYLTILS
ncbi:MAG: hypothetical protein JSV56_00995 [Methanomassiliicoccales archaeon]|nr:MAG: hypothetical protein JSV56_00995 [Methanomassiliicoccales archaeon]